MLNMPILLNNYYLMHVNNNLLKPIVEGSEVFVC